MGDFERTGMAGDSEWTFQPGEIELTNTVLGRGAFGEVRVAKWRNVAVACKSLHAVDTAHQDASDRDGLRHEISMLSKLRHPNLVLFIGVCHGLVSNTTSILTELLPCSLYDVLEVNKTTLSLPDILDIALDVVNGLDYLHKHDPSIVHRDISAKNILIGGNSAKIADLGQAKIFGHNTLSRQTGMPGAMAYSAPEVLTGKYSAKIDIFSFGVLLAQMCTNEYPRIDRREDQITKACETHPLFRSLIQSAVSYQPHERPTAEAMCKVLEVVKENDRHYPLSRTIAPEKDIGILGRHWMQAQIDRQCEQVVVELHRTKSLLAAEEARWQAEAAKVDGINDQLREARALHAGALEQLTRLQIEHREQLHHRTLADAAIANLRAQLAATGGEIQRLESSSTAKDTQLAQQWQDLSDHRDALSRYHDEYQVAAQLLETSRRSEADLQRRNEQLKMQLDMQVEYVRDLEGRLEQALTRWKLEKDNLRDEKARYGKLNTHSATIVALNDRLKQDIARYEARLAQYADLPLPASIDSQFVFRTEGRLT
jgi:serine/threonine protein kinase